MNFYKYPHIQNIPCTKDKVDELMKTYEITEEHHFIIHPKIKGISFQIELDGNNRYYGSSEQYYSEKNNPDIHKLQSFVENKYGEFLDYCCKGNLTHLTLYLQAFGSTFSNDIDYQTDDDVIIYDINSYADTFGKTKERVIVPHMGLTIIMYALECTCKSKPIKYLTCFPIRNIKNLLYELTDEHITDKFVDVKDYVFKSKNIERLSFKFPISFYNSGFIIKPYDKVITDKQGNQLLLKIESFKK